MLFSKVLLPITALFAKHGSASLQIVRLSLDQMQRLKLIIQSVNLI